MKRKQIEAGVKLVTDNGNAVNSFSECSAAVSVYRPMLFGDCVGFASNAEVGKHEFERGRDAAFEFGRVHARVLGNGNGPDGQAKAVFQFPREGAGEPKPRPATGVRRTVRRGHHRRSGRDRFGRCCQGCGSVCLRRGRSSELLYQSAERKQLQRNGEAVSARLGQSVHARVPIAARRRGVKRRVGRA